MRFPQRETDVRPGPLTTIHRASAGRTRLVVEALRGSGVKIYTYVIAVDGGAAPNREPPLTTLAICKPRIRRGANPGAMVLAFNGAALGGDSNGVRWAGVVHEKLTFAE